MTTPVSGTASCPICRAEFIPAGPRHRYCCERCRKTAWRRRHPRPGDQDTVPRPGDVPRDVPAVPVSAETASPQKAPPTRCPHCAGPIAVISLLVAPAAAHVTAPGNPHGR